jgi:hypothetical protein
MFEIRLRWVFALNARIGGAITIGLVRSVAIGYGQTGVSDKRWPMKIASAVACAQLEDGQAIRR